MGAQGFYQITLESLGENSTANERLWFKTNLKLCGLWFRTREYGRATRTLKELHRWPPPSPPAALRRFD